MPRLWSDRRVLITPHISNGSDQNQHGGVDVFCDNLRAYRDGQAAAQRDRLATRLLTACCSGSGRFGGAASRTCRFSPDVLYYREVEGGVHQARPHRPRRVADLPRLHELRRRQPRQSRLEPRRGGEPPVHQAGARSRHQFLRHREPLFARQQRGDPRPRDQGFRPARRGGHRHQGLWPDAAGTQWRRPVAQGDHGRDR